MQTFGYAQQYSRVAQCRDRFYDDAGNVIQTHEHKSEFKGILTAVPAL